SGMQVLRVTQDLKVSAHAEQCSLINDSGFGGSAVPSNAGPGGRPDFWFEEEQNADGVTFTFGSGSVTKAEKLYRNVFFEGQDLDRFVIKSGLGDYYVVTVWGDAECNTCPPGTQAGVQGEDKVCGVTEARELVKEAEMTW